MRRSRRNRPPASWRRAVAHGANAAARRGAGHGFETRRLAARNPSHRTAAGRHARRSRQLAVCAGVATVVHGGRRCRCDAVAVAASPRIFAAARAASAAARPSEPQYVVLGMAGCEADTGTADQVVLPLLRGAGGDASDEVAAGLCRLGTADWRARCSSTSATPRRRRCAPACASSSRRTSACERRCSGRG